MNEEEALNKIKKLQKFVEGLNKQQIDFSKFVGRYDDILAIKGNKYLKFYKGVIWDNYNKHFYTDELHYEEIDHTKLKDGDVYYAGSLEDAKGDMKLDYFAIHIGFDDDDNSSRVLYLKKMRGNEIIENCNYSGRVVRFLRK